MIVVNINNLENGALALKTLKFDLICLNKKKSKKCENVVSKVSISIIDLFAVLHIS